MSNEFWAKKKVLVTGGAGFIGSHLVEALAYKGAKVTVLDNLENGNLDNLKNVVGRYKFIRGDCSDGKVAFKACAGKDVVMNLAARVGGIEYNRRHQATMMKDNLLIETVMMEAARKNRVGRYLVVSSACVYPRNSSVPTPESEGFLDEPEPTNSGYGWAKRMGELLGKFYVEEFGMKVSIARPYNCYGPRDNFDPERSHVIPALIQRICNGEDPLVVWGSGDQIRSFIYVTDLVDGLIDLCEKYPVADPINIGSSEETSIKDLASLLLKLTGSDSKIDFDTSKPDGQFRRSCDVRRAQKKIGFQAKVSLADGLKNTLEWYRKR